MDRQLPLPPPWDNPVYGYPGHAAPLTQNPPAFQHPSPPGVPADQYAYAGHPSNSFSWACYGSAAPPPPGLESWQRSSSTPNTPQPVTDEAPELMNERKRPFGPADKTEDLQQQLDDTKMQLERSQKANRDLVAWIRRELARSQNRQHELEAFLSRLTVSTDSRSPATNQTSRRENTTGKAQQGLGNSRGQPGSNSLQGPVDHQKPKSRNKLSSHQRKAKRKAMLLLQEGDSASGKTEDDAEEAGGAAQAQIQEDVQSQDDALRALALGIPPLVHPTHHTRY